MRIIASVATTGTREASLEMMMESLQGQVDELVIYDNSKQTEDLTDNGKFHALQFYTEPVYFFTIDDDLLFPPDYVERTLEAHEKHKGIITHHGRILNGKGLNYYRGHKTFGCLHYHPLTETLDVAGSGVSMWSTAEFNPLEIYASKDKRMADLVLSLEAAKQGVKITHMARPQHRWIRYIEQPKGTTIYEMENKDCTRQNELADQIYDLRHGGR